MIDLTKPIRRKNCAGGSLYPMQATAGKHYVLLEYTTPGGRCMIAESYGVFERDYENIPESRKPKEWMAYENRSDVGLHQYCSDCIGKCIRVIEWPVGAPLPAWPEGYE